MLAAVLVAAAAPVGVDQARRMAAGEPGTARVARAEDGHFWATAATRQGAVRVLVDTGASAVALTLADAEALGVDVARLDFSQTIEGAGGSMRAADVTLDRITVGDATVERVRTLVVAEGLDRSLLGMSFLGRLSRFEATPQVMVLTR
jgi:aspartyl protease family protein